ncbi:hypothetical protein Pyrfu_1021 [Pyrolobus fumarii 1A]|uniref:Uncharacterized protein n=1 Tax=Pyrolobus fumarii (strain DSM 11204 / 1A) TaxID=694429 RepID=G0EER7_PYRF1|nr:hypothetical protein Pyrfu_1021 [Pyrolobus fumarii 1A]
MLPVLALASAIVYTVYHSSSAPMMHSTDNAMRVYSRSLCAYRMLFYDPLALEYPNQTLLRQIEYIVNESGGCLDAYIGEEAGLEPLLHLDKYDIIVIRAHGGIWDGRGFYFATGLSPQGPYDIPVLLVQKLAKNGVLEAGSPAVLSEGAVISSSEYIIVGALFFKHVARLKKGAVVVVASCDSLNDPRFVEAVLTAGAVAYIGWMGKTTPSAIDDMLPSLIKLIVEHLDNPCEALTNLKIIGVKLVAPTGAVLSGVCKE